MKTQHSEEARVLGSAIRASRDAKRIPREKLAGALGISQEQLRRIETGNSYPSFELLFNIAAALNEAPSKLLRATDGIVKSTRSGVAQLAARLTVNQQSTGRPGLMDLRFPPRLAIGTAAFS